MKAEFKVNVAAILIILVGVAFFFWFNKEKNRTIQSYLNTISHNEFVFETWKSEVDSVDVIQQNMLDAADAALREALQRDSIQRELVTHYKNLSAIIKIETNFIHDTVKVSVPIYIKEDITVNLSDKCMDVDLSLTSGLLSLDRVDIHNRQDIAIGTQRSGLKNTESVVTIRNTNPCIKTTGIQSYTVIYEKQWWENPIITTLGGFTAGWVVGKLSN